MEIIGWIDLIRGEDMFVVKDPLLNSPPSEEY